ncbi:hypothetical protein LJC23_07735 [Desulfovibrio sp. OttesenSCG-928-I05]|nr:hypothetical protein [Desulfovibrio sp. OttesenSCG-928-I05]
MAEYRNIFELQEKQALGDADTERKRAIYETMSPRGKRFVDKLGFDAWDPFQEPKDPLDIRTDVTRRTTQQLVRLFLQSRNGPVDNAYSQGVLDCALGLVNKDEKFRGVYEFCLWYNELLRSEGYLDHS